MISRCHLHQNVGYADQQKGLRWFELSEENLVNVSEKITEATAATGAAASTTASEATASAGATELRVETTGGASVFVTTSVTIAATTATTAPTASTVGARAEARGGLDLGGLLESSGHSLGGEVQVLAEVLNAL